MRLKRPIQTRFRYGYPSRVNLATYRNSQAHSSKGTRSLHSGRSQNAPTACRHTVSGTISRPLTGVLFTFPSRYWFTIGHQGVFSLTRWSSQLLAGFHVSRDTQGTRRSQSHVVYRAVTVSGRSFQIVRLHDWFVTPCDGPYNPSVQAHWFGLIRVRSPLLAESLLFSLPVGTEMVHFPTLPSHRLWIQRWIL